jgi:hypothetical protein
MLARSAEALFANLIDYAGLFPPAALSMAGAVRNYGAYRRGEYAWMLGRFVLNADQISEAMTAAASTSHPLVMTDLSVLAAANAFPKGAGVVETKAATVAAIAGIDAGERTVYVEVSDLDLIDALATAGLRAKIRTGGVTAEAFPAATHVAGFIRRCAAHGVAFKATAGLHHPIRCLKPLTYAANAPRGTMHGFVNVFLAAALPEHAESILTEDDPHAFTFDDDAAAWRGHAVHIEDLVQLRREFAISFGSCSFEEPIADLKELGWL